MLIRWGFVLAILTGLQLPVTAEDLAREQLEELFNAGWPKTPAAPTDAEHIFRELTIKSKGDPRVTYAFALIKLRQLKYPDAEKLLEELLDEHGDDVHAWRLRIWINISRRDFEKGLNEMVKLAELFPAEPDTIPGPNEILYLDSARFLGRVFGFLDGPVAGNVNETIRADFREKIVASLGPKRRELFNEGRDAVTDKYLELTDQQAASKAKAKTEKREEREQKLKDLGEQKDLLGRRSESLREQNDKLKSEFKEKMEALERKDGPLKARFAQLDAVATTMRGQLQVMNGDLALLQGRFDTEKDPQLRGRIRNQMDLISISAGRVNADLAVATRQAAGVVAERNELQRQANVVEGQAARESDQQNRAFDDLQRKQKSTESQEKRVKKSAPNGDATEIRVRSTVATSFVTYEPFPLEKERQRLLDSIPERK